MSNTARTVDDLVYALRDEPVTLPPAERARAIRVAAGATQADIAAVCGTSRVAVTRWETGKRIPRGEQRRRYAEALEALRNV